MTLKRSLLLGGSALAAFTVAMPASAQVTIGGNTVVIDPPGISPIGNNGGGPLDLNGSPIVDSGGSVVVNDTLDVTGNARVQTHSEPEGDGGGECYAREEVGGEFVVAGVDASEVFETAKGVFDQVPTAIAVLVVADRPLPVAPPWYDGNSPILA